MDVVRPATVDELAALLRDTQSSAPVVRVRGGATKWSWGAPGPEPDLVVDMTAMDAVEEHAAGDLVATVQAGARLADVQAELGRQGQWLALDPPEGDATIGGVVGAAAAGPRRLRYGTVRDLLIGVTVVLADGTVARSGGKVVKNVAGYDLGKLFTGSFGTLGAIATCTFRLHPLPPARRVVSIEGEPAPIVRELLRSTVTPSAIEWDGERVQVVIESTDTAATAQAEQVLALAGGGTVSEQVTEGFGARPWRDGELAVKVTHRLSALGPALDAVRRRLAGARVTAHAGSGVMHAGWPADPATAKEAVEQLRRDIAAHDGTVVVLDAPDDVKAGLDVWGPVAGIDVMRRIKEQFDPGGRMSPGRFVGGI